jgi:hypothetical protein
MAIHTTTAFAFGSDSVSTTVIALVDLTGLSDELVAQADRARITVATNPVRYRYDGDDPTATVGHYLAADSETEIVGRQNIGNLRFIRAGGSDGVVSVTLEGD